MADFLLRLFSLSAGGAAAILALLAIERFAGLRYAAKWRCLAWLLLCLRLAIPASLSWSSGLPAAPIRVEVPADQVIYRPSAASGARPTQPAAPRQPDGTPEPAAPEPAKTARLVTLSDALFALWLFGAIGVPGRALIGHLRFTRYLRRWASPVGEQEAQNALNEWKETLHLRRTPRLMTCPELDTPMLAGLVSVCLLLPADAMDGMQLRHALLHELTHYKRRDILFKALVLWVCALHWFNPAVWLMRRAVERDLELACDDAALCVLPESERAAYGQTILQAVERRRRT